METKIGFESDKYQKYLKEITESDDFKDYMGEDKEFLAQVAIEFNELSTAAIFLCLAVERGERINKNHPAFVRLNKVVWESDPDMYED